MATDNALLWMPVHPHFAAKALLVLIFTLGDLAINCFADHHDFTQNGDWYLAVLFSIQAVIQVVNFLMLFLMLVATYLFQVGLVALLAKDFKPFAFISLVYFASLLAYGGVKMHLIFAEHKDRLSSWDDNAFYGLFVIHKTMAPMYYIAVLHVVLKLAQPKWYAKETWVARFQAA